jgi:tetratricopeptide (TPR) repeat protein
MIALIGRQWLSMSDEQGRRPARAVQALRHAISLNSQLAVAHANLALALAQVGEFEQAESALKRAIALGYWNVPVIQERITNLKRLAGRQ